MGHSVGFLGKTALGVGVCTSDHQQLGAGFNLILSAAQSPALTLAIALPCAGSLGISSPQKVQNHNSGVHSYNHYMDSLSRHKSSAGARNLFHHSTPDYIEYQRMGSVITKCYMQAI